MKLYTYKGYSVYPKYRQWFSNDFKGSFATLEDFRKYIDGRLGRKNLQDREK